MDSLENQLLIAMPSLDDGYFNKTVTYICEHNDEGAMGLIINSPVNITLYDLLKQIEDNDAEYAQKHKKQASKKSSHFSQETDNKEIVQDETTNIASADDETSSTDANTKSNDVLSCETVNSLKDKLLSTTISVELEQLVLSGGPIAQQRGFVLHSTQKGWSSSLALSKEVMITTSKDILLALGTDDAPEKFMVTLGYAGWGPGQLEEEIKANSWLITPADNDILFNTPIELRWKKATEKLGIDIAHLSSEIGHA